MSVNTISNTFRIQYQDEFKMDYERNQSILRMTVNTNATLIGSELRWDRVDAGDQAQERGRDGKLPVSQLGLAQVPATVREFYKKYRSDSFDILRANKNTRTAQYKRAIGSVNRSIDSIIIAALDATSTQVSGSGAALSTFAAVEDWLVRLYENDVQPTEDIYGIVTPRAFSQMKRIPEFKNKDFVVEQIFVNGTPNSMKVWPWNGVKWVVHNGLTGRGTNNAPCYLYTRDALGHGLDGDPVTHVGWDEGEDQYFTWARARHAAVAVLPRGICRFRHDDTAALA
jgi:hypothetical protein